MINDTLRSNIIARRKHLNLTQEGLAAAIGISPNTYQRWESRPWALTLDKLDKIAEALGTTRGNLQGSGLMRTAVLEEPQASLDSIESFRDSFKRLNEDMRALKENNQCLILLAEKLQAENDALSAENAELKARLGMAKK